MPISIDFTSLPNSSAYTIPAPWVRASWGSTPSTPNTIVRNPQFPTEGQMVMGFGGTYGYLADTGSRDGVFILDRADATSGAGLALRAGSGLAGSIRVGRLHYPDSSNNNRIAVWLGTSGMPAYTVTVPGYSSLFSEIHVHLVGDSLRLWQRDKRFPSYYAFVGDYNVSGTSTSTSHGLWSFASGGDNRLRLSAIRLYTLAESPFPVSVTPVDQSRLGNYVLDPTTLPTQAYWTDPTWVSTYQGSTVANPIHYGFSVKTGRVYSDTQYAPGSAYRDCGSANGDIRLEGFKFQNRQLVLRGYHGQTGVRIGINPSPVSGKYGLIVTVGSSGSHFIPVSSSTTWFTGTYSLWARIMGNQLSVWFETPTTPVVQALDLNIINSARAEMPVHGFAWTASDPTGYLSRFEFKPFTAPEVAKRVPARLHPRPKALGKDWYAGDQMRPPLRLWPL